MEDHSCVPVFLEQELMDKYYNGFSNDVLWPLFHYVPLPMYKAGSEKKFDNCLWEAYKVANKRCGCSCCRGEEGEAAGRNKAVFRRGLRRSRLLW